MDLKDYADPFPSDQEPDGSFRNMDAENALLGCLIRFPTEPRGAAWLRPEDFYTRRCQDVFRAIQALWSERAPVSILSVSDRLQKTRQLSGIGGDAWLMDLVDSVVSSAELEGSRKIVVEYAIRRESYRLDRLAEKLEEEGNLQGARSIRERTMLLYDRLRASEGSDPFKLLGILTRMDMDNLPEPDWLIDGVLPERGMSLLASPPGVGKSFVGVDFSLSVCIGREWCRKRVKQGPVLYVSREGADGFRRRLEAWEKEHYFGGKVTNFFHLPTSFNLLDEELVGMLRQVVEHIKPALVVFDTLSRNIVGVDENDQAAMSKVIEAAESVKALGPHVMIVHHSSAAGRVTRGSTVIPGGVDTILALKKVGGGKIEMECVKQKDGPDGWKMQFEMVEVKLGPERTSVILAELDEFFVDNVSKERMNKESLVMAVLRSGKTNAKEISDASTLSQRSVQRILQRLVEEGKIERHGETRNATWTILAARGIAT